MEQPALLGVSGVPVIDRKPASLWISEVVGLLVAVGAVVGQHQAAQRLAQAEAAGRARCGGAVFGGAAGGFPGGQTAVEHRHGVVPGPLEHPPQAPAEGTAVAVVDHGLGVVVHAKPLQPLRQQLSFRERVATAVDRVLGPRGAQVALQIGPHGTGNVLAGVHRVGLRPVGQIGAAVEHQQRRATGLQLHQLIDGDQVGVAHVRDP